MTYPKTLILPLETEWIAFLNRVRGLPLVESDYSEIVTQIFDCFMDYCYEYEVKLATLPVTNRIANPVFENVLSLEYRQLFNAVQMLISDIRDHITEVNGLYDKESQKAVGFPYFFDRFLNKDVILGHIPF